MVNGFGFAQPIQAVANGTEKCFNTFAEVVEEVDKWFKKHLKTHTLAEALCGYNKGFNGEAFRKCLNMNPETPYLRNFINLANKQ